jgi:hypothetical protein
VRGDTHPRGMAIQSAEARESEGGWTEPGLQAI